MRDTRSPLEIQRLVIERIRELPDTERVLERVAVRLPVPVAAVDGCNWDIRVTGVPLPRFRDVAAVIGRTRGEFNL
jgi:hypothetical protein